MALPRLSSPYKGEANRVYQILKEGGGEISLLFIFFEISKNLGLKQVKILQPVS